MEISKESVAIAKQITPLINQIPSPLLYRLIPLCDEIVFSDDMSINQSFQSHFEGYKPIEFIANLCVSYIEELIHASDPAKTETQIQEIVCSAIEGFLEIKLPYALKQYRLSYAKTCDDIHSKKNSPA